MTESNVTGRGILAPKSRRAEWRMSVLLLACLWLAPVMAQTDAASSAPAAATPTAAAAPPPASAAPTPRWMQPLPAARSTQAAANYQRYCSLCHGSDRQGHVNDHAPSLRSKSLLESGMPMIIGEAIAYGRPGTPMGGYLDEVGGPLAHQDIRELVMWLRETADIAPAAAPARRDITGSVENGATLYQTHCAQCHGASGEGGTGTALGNPTMLALTSDTFLRHAIEHGREQTPMPAFGNTLTATQIDDVVVFLRSRSSGWTLEKRELRRPPAVSEYVVNPQGEPPAFTLKDGRYVMAADLDRELAAKRRMVLLDTRVTSMWQRAHIEGSVPIPYYADRDAALASLPRDGTWIVAYCECPRAAADSVVKWLREDGFANTAVLWEGIQGWVSLGYPVTAGDASPEPSAAPAPPAADTPAASSSDEKNIPPASGR